MKKCHDNFLCSNLSYLSFQFSFSIRARNGKISQLTRYATDLNDLFVLIGQMNLILLYGPFASGKLTIGKELQKITGYKFLENNAINRPPLQVFPFGTPVFKRLTGKFRLDICKEAAVHNVNLITSLVYLAGEDDDYIRELIEAVTSEGGNIKFVRVKCNEEALLKRVSEKSREGKGKILDPDYMKELLYKNNITNKIPFVESLEVDSTEKTAEECALLIKEHLL